MELPVSMRRSPAGCLTRMLLPVMAKGKPVKVLPVSTQQAARPLSGLIVGATRACCGAAGKAGRGEERKGAPTPAGKAQSTQRVASRRDDTPVRGTAQDPPEQP